VCWRCGRPGPVGARFCPSCGAAQEAPGSPPLQLWLETRKVVTVLFADLVNSTLLTHRLDPEDARRVAAQFYALALSRVDRYGGQVANFLGDAVLAVFGLPVAHEDDPERAVYAALDLVASLPQLNGVLSRRYAMELAVRVGVETGEVVAVSGSAFDRDFLVSEGVTAAAHLQHRAAPGTVVVGARTYHASRHAVAYAELPPAPAKDRQEPVPAWQARGRLSGHATEQVRPGPFVGRSRELAALLELYRGSLAGSSSVLVTVVGEAGVGKSRLVQEFVESAKAEGDPLVLRSRAVPLGPVGYHVFGGILTHQWGAWNRGSPEKAQARLGAWLGDILRGTPRRALRDLAARLLVTFGGPRFAGQDPTHAREVVAGAWAELLGAAASRRPVVVAVEDLHWADPATLELLHTVVGHAQGGPLLVLCTARSGCLQPHLGSWGSCRGEMLRLGPLGPGESEALVAALSGGALDLETRRLVASRAEGNPLFARELVRAAREKTPTDIPDTLRALVTAQVDQLPPLERAVLLGASVVGRVFWPPAVARIVGGDRTEVARAVEDLEAREWVVAQRTSSVRGAREFAFRHGLARDVAYGLLPKEQRRRAHAVVLRWLEETPRDRLEQWADLVAEHAQQAGDHVARELAETTRRCADLPGALGS
jgi:class 3 adenylate cyclase